MKHAELLSIYIGRVANPWPGKEASAIGKTLVTGAQSLMSEGLVGDQQADRSVHGGPDKAVHVYCAAHYPVWRDELDRDDMVPGRFGENFAVSEWSEHDVCIGDVFTIGAATVQISQGRQPCWKLAMHTGNDRMAYLFQTTGRTGWYFRVLETGEVTAGDQFTLIDRPCPDWSVADVTRARLTRKVSTADAKTLSNLPELADDWRRAFARFAGGDVAEDTSKRLGG